MDGSNKDYLQVLDREIAATQEQLEDAQRKLTILRNLRDNFVSGSDLREPAEGGRYLSAAGFAEPAGGGRYTAGGGRSGVAAPGRPSSKRQVATEAIVAFLRHQRGPVPTVSILAHLKDHGIAFGGHQPRNALSVMLSRSKRFRAHGRQGWTLADDRGG